VSQITTAFHELRLSIILVDFQIPIFLIKPVSESIVSFLPMGWVLGIRCAPAQNVSKFAPENVHFSTI